MIPHLKTIRVARELSQGDLARGAKFRQTYISALERGLIPARPEHVTRLARALSVDEAVLTAHAIVISADGSIEVAR